MDSEKRQRCASCGMPAHDYGLDGCVNMLLAEVARLREGIRDADANPCYCPMPHPRHHPEH